MELNLNSITCSDAMTFLRSLPDESVHCVVTSPPYWGLRDYGTGEWQGGDPDCEHKVGGQVADSKWEGAITTGVRPGVDASTCRKCGAERIDQQIGLEPTIQDHIDALVTLFREVRRVLRKDGTLFLNYGDCYASSVNGRSAADTKATGNDDRTFRDKPFSTVGGTLKPKDLCMLPHRVAIALQDDGWWVRADIVWAKPNPMPESARDRPTRSHEYIFLLAKSRHYWYDDVAVSEPAKYANDPRGSRADRRRGVVSNSMHGKGTGERRNKRDVWSVNTVGFKGAHFATFPPKLIEPCILAGCPDKVCATCGKPWKRLVERTFVPQPDVSIERGVKGASGQKPMDETSGWDGVPRGTTRVETVGWAPACKHEGEPVPGVVLDMFAGAGTVGLVAKRLGRSYLLNDLSPAYVAMAQERIANDAPKSVKPKKRKNPKHRTPELEPWPQLELPFVMEVAHEHVQKV